MRALGVFAFGLVFSACPSGTGGGSACVNGGCKSGNACHSTLDCHDDAGFICVQGVCAGACGDAGTCASGEICGVVNKRLVCLSPCNNGACAFDAGCQMFWPTRQQVCAQRPFPNACASVVDEVPCTACDAIHYTTPCDNSFCPTSSSCNPLNPIEEACGCNPGTTAYACDGTACETRQGGCIGGEWTCRPDNPPTSVCIEEELPASGHCVCSDGRMPTFTCGETSSCEHRCSVGCDLRAQDCPDAFAPKCTGVSDAGVPARDRVECVALTGSKQLGDTCTRTAPGIDDCDKGLYCSGDGAPHGMMLCRKLCTATSECGATEICAHELLTIPPTGYCMPSGCALYGNDCGAGHSCTSTETVERGRKSTCKQDGAAAAGQACHDDTDCGPNLACSTGVCAPTCSGQVACDAGSCFEFWDPNEPSVCL